MPKRRKEQMSQIYISSTLLWGKNEEKLLKTARSMGVKGIELWAQQFFYCGFDVDEYNYYSHLYGLKTCVHACSWDLNLSSLNSEIRKTSVKQVKASLKLANRLCAREVTVHPGHLSLAQCRKDEIALMQDSLESIYAYSEKQHIPVSLEIMEKTKKEFVTDRATMKEATGALFGKFHYTVDAAHCDCPEEIFNLLDTMPRVSKIHITNRQGPRYHTPLPDGDFDFRNLMPRILSYHLPLVVEGFDSDPECPVLKKDVHFLKETGGLHQ
jgi:sugar phosphate isomerase/epimerase